MNKLNIFVSKKIQIQRTSESHRRQNIGLFGDIIELLMLIIKNPVCLALY